MEHIIAQIQDLADSQEGPPAAADSRNTNVPTSNKLLTMFDFNAPFWRAYDQRSAIYNLNTELQMLDLVEQEGITEENADFDLDPTMTSFIIP